MFSARMQPEPAAGLCPGSSSHSAAQQAPQAGSSRQQQCPTRAHPHRLVQVAAVGQQPLHLTGVRRLLGAPLLQAGSQIAGDQEARAHQPLAISVACEFPPPTKHLDRGISTTQNCPHAPLSARLHVHLLQAVLLSKPLQHAPPELLLVGTLRSLARGLHAGEESSAGFGAQTQTWGWGMESRRACSMQPVSWSEISAAACTSGLQR